VIRSIFNSSFFRQSAWMLFATLANGAFMAAVQWAALRMPRDTTNGIGTFLSLLDVLGQLSIPITGVLTVFMQQTVMATTDEAKRQLVGTARGILGGMLALWLVFAILSLVFQNRIIGMLKLPNSTVWWFTMLACLAALLAPTLTGILQGEQKFFWVGWANILNGVGRFVGVVVAVVWLQKGATGAMAGVFLGNLLTLLLVAWMTRWIWKAPSLPPDWRGWLKQVIPLTLGVAAPTYIFTQDMVVVQQYFSTAEANAYGAPRVIGRVLFFLVAPMTLVMFPRIARSAATSEETNVLAQAVGATALIGGGAALACTFFPELMLRIMSPKGASTETAWLIPWFAWCMLPLALSNLLANNLLARKRFAAVPWMLAVAIGYRVTLHFLHDSYLTVILTLGGFSLALFLVCVVFTIRQPRSPTPR
jgi:O-antigen/teichoic acid export membrane protein